MLLQAISVIEIKAVREQLERTTPLSGTEKPHDDALQAFRDLEKAQQSVFELERSLTNQQRSRIDASRN